MSKMTEEEMRRDHFDFIISEYLRTTKKSVEYLCEHLGCSLSSLWRYRYTIQGFSKMPQDILANCFRQVNASNEDIRMVLGLPTGMRNDISKSGIRWTEP